MAFYMVVFTTVTHKYIYSLHSKKVMSTCFIPTDYCWSYCILKYTVYSGISVVVDTLPSFFLPDITITKWHMPFVRQQLVCAMEETFWKKVCVKFANINLVSIWTAKFQLNELPFKCSRPWLHTFNPEVNLIWSQRAVQRHNPLIDKANWVEMRVKEQKKEPSQWRRG